MTDALTLKTVNSLLGEHFFVPYYQRGYRWTRQQVTDLLNDVWTFANRPKKQESTFYCLQPVVVKQKQWSDESGHINGWEVIDGQQRLTTLHIILSFLTREFLKVEDLKEDYGRSSFSIRYETRPGSEHFLRNISPDRSTIDYYHISEAYATVAEWFNDQLVIKDRTDKNKFLSTILGKESDESSVQVIWYKVDPETPSIPLFNRLNIGKIPLTNAELIKALFLSSSSFENIPHDDAVKNKLEISLLWDEIEHQLADESFWSFITNESQSRYATKIDILFEMISGRKKTEIDPLFTFLFFQRKAKSSGDGLWPIWLSIEQHYATLRQWYTEKDSYHKIGYLVAVGEDISHLIARSVKLRKSEFQQELDDRIKTHVHYNLEELRYDSPADYRKIENILLLFNVESVRTGKSISDYYPFRLHKGAAWSLEHIHAQNPEGLDQNKKDSWQKWLHAHQTVLFDMIAAESDIEKSEHWKQLYEKITHTNFDTLTWERFSLLSEEVINVFSSFDEDQADTHGISNLALLSQPDNSTLNNSVFEVKRREIIRLDKEGSYIPICTRRAFLKYYNDDTAGQQLYFWSNQDREKYLNEIRNVLDSFLPPNPLNLN